VTPDQLRERIAQLESQLADIDSERRLLSGQLKLHQAELHLRTGGDPNILATQMRDATQGMSREGRAHIAAGITQHGGHPFVAAVLSDPRWGSIAAWAADHCRHCMRRAEQSHAHGAFEAVSPATVSSWYTTSKTAKRKIPDAWARLIEQEFTDGLTGKSDVPAADKTWRNGIT